MKAQFIFIVQTATVQSAEEEDLVHKGTNQARQRSILCYFIYYCVTL